ESEPADAPNLSELPEGPCSLGEDYSSNSGHASDAADTPDALGAQSAQAPNFLPPEVYPLVFNTEFSEMSASRVFAPNFSYELTAEQFSAVFPSLETHFTATVLYWLETERILYWLEPVTEVISLVPPEPKIDQVEVAAFDSEGRTQIRLGEGQAADSFITLIGEPQISYVHEIAVTATLGNGYFVIDDEIAHAYFARVDFVLGNIAYSVSYHNVGEEAVKLRLTELVNQLIIGGAANWDVLADPIIPHLREERLPLNEARNDPDFGAFLPASIPGGFVFEHARRSLNQNTDSLTAFWNGAHPSFDSIRWVVKTPQSEDLARVVSVNDRYKYDVSLYPVPWADSVPIEIHYYFQSPVFLAEEFTSDIISARTRWTDGDEGIPGWHTSQFGVLFDGILVVVSMRGLSPEQIWEMWP
ncbi:MAG: hypothetical protein FWB75_01285, partial [Oscillospiraceae bacterium]|nr:hypothetical protein [Oscillospiraceae bacterium]